MDLRNIGIEALKVVIKVDKNVKLIENFIFNKTKGNEDKYKKIIYQTVGDILNKKKLKEILTNINKNKTGFNHPFYKEISDVIKEQNDFIKNPFLNIEKGVIKCNKCNSERVFSYAKQTRSGDEATSVFCECVECKSKWII